MTKTLTQKNRAMHMTLKFLMSFVTGAVIGGFGLFLFASAMNLRGIMFNLPYVFRLGSLDIFEIISDEKITGIAVRQGAAFFVLGVGLLNVIIVFILSFVKRK